MQGITSRPRLGLFPGIPTIDHVVVTLIDHFILHKQLPQWVGARTDIIHVTHLMVGGDFSNCSIISPELLINPMHQRLQEHEGGREGLLTAQAKIAQSEL